MGAEATEAKNQSIKKGLMVLLIVLVFVLVIWAIVFKCNVNKQLHIEKNAAMSLWERFNYKLVPFERDIEHIKAGSVSELLALIFNVVAFLVIGCLLRFVVNVKATLLIGFLFTSSVELFQLFSAWGGFDFMDLATNMLGLVLGILSYKVIFSKLPSKVINALIYICLTIAVPLSIFAIVNTSINFPV